MEHQKDPTAKNKEEKRRHAVRDMLDGKVDPKQNFAKMEEEILSFWDEKKIFEKSVEKNSADKSFYHLSSFSHAPVFLPSSNLYLKISNQIYQQFFGPTDE